MLSRSTIRRITRSLLATMLFAQGALAASVCDMPERSAAKAIASGAMPCHQTAPAERNANLCLADCLSFDQSTDTPQLPALAPYPAPMLVVEIAAPALPRSEFAGHWLAASTAPPPRILFQSLLI